MINKNIFIALGAVFCISFTTGCNNKEKTNLSSSIENDSPLSESSNSITSESSNEIINYSSLDSLNLSSISSEPTSSDDSKVTITFLQYECSMYVDANRYTIIVFYNRLLTSTKVEFPKGYYLSFEELDDVALTLNRDTSCDKYGYFTFTSFYYDKDNPKEDERLGNTYLNEDMTVYFGIY